MSDHYLKRELYERVREDEGIFEFLQDAALDGCWYWDLEQPEHEWMNRRFWELLGYDPATKKHRADEWQDLIHPDDLKTALANFQSHCADPDHPYDQVVRYRHRDGSTVWVRCRGLAIRDSEGQAVRMLGAHVDVTELKQTEEELRAALASNEELEQFAYVASHDLREPLRLIRAYLDLLSEHCGELLDESARSYLRTAVEASESMQRQISGLLAYARIASDPPMREEVDLTVLLDAVRGRLEVLFSEEDAELTHDVLPRVAVDRPQMELLLQCLVTNAIEHRSARTPKVHVSADRGEDGWLIHVDDNGNGVPAEARERVFQMFQQLEADNLGAGIGLAIARRIVRRHGGTIWADDAPGGGARFTFSLSGDRPESGNGATPR
mgnify:FL=1